MGHGYYEVNPHTMARVCRRMASDMRREHAVGMPPISMTSHGNCKSFVPRDQAAASMDRQAERWETERDTGVPNIHDRTLIGA